MKGYDFTNKPCAAKGLISYRYKGRFGWIMIGARDNEDALNEAGRSTDDEIKGENLQIWDGARYIDVV
jgi:hypothetical protein